MRLGTTCALLVFVLVLLTPAARAQAVPADLADIVHQQFGACFEIPATRTEVTTRYLHPQAAAPWVVFLGGDLDGDGVPDAVIVARCKDPLGHQGEYNYRVVDPYFSAHGYGNPKITASFNTEDPAAGNNLVLIIHGAGPQGWRAPTPKSKFVLINLPLQTLSLTRVQHRKHDLAAIDLEDTDNMSSLVFWDGKKYRWVDNGGQP